MDIFRMPQLNDNLKIRLSFVGAPSIEAPSLTQIEGGVDSSALKIQYNVSVVINRPESKVNVIVSMAYMLDQEKLFSGSLTTGYEVVNLASYISATEGDDKFRIESDFLPMLINSAFSTTRGYFTRELANTVLAPYPFPMISMDNIQKRTSFQLI